jgi:hypothetical protein
MKTKPIRRIHVSALAAALCAPAARAQSMALTPGYGGGAGLEYSMSLPPFVWGPMLVVALGCALWLLSLALVQPRRRRVPSPLQGRLGAVRRWLAVRQPRRVYAGPAGLRR